MRMVKYVEKGGKGMAVPTQIASMATTAFASKLPKLGGKIVEHAMNKTRNPNPFAPAVAALAKPGMSDAMRRVRNMSAEQVKRLTASIKDFNPNNPAHVQALQRKVQQLQARMQKAAAPAMRKRKTPTPGPSASQRSLA